VIEIEFAKQRGRPPRPNQKVDIEAFIAVKGIKAIGNQLTPEKVKSINVLDPLPYEEPLKQEPLEMEVVDEEDVEPGNRVYSGNSPETEKPGPDDKDKGGDGQTALF